MKTLCLFLSLFLSIPGFIGARNHSLSIYFMDTQNSFEKGKWPAAEPLFGNLDTVPGPKVEILGKMKIAELPVGTGVEVLADEEGNLFKRSGMNMMPTGNKDSITYTVISGFGPVFPPGTHDLLGFAISGGQGSGAPVWNITKKRDANSVGFMYLFTTAPANNDNIQIEINIYESGSTTPYYSHKFTDISVLSTSISPSDVSQIESYSLIANIYGIKDHITGVTFAWDYSNMIEVIGYF